jgi:hypothetical protein
MTAQARAADICKVLAILLKQKWTNGSCGLCSLQA